MHHPSDRITHTTAFVTPVVEHWLERATAQWLLEDVVSVLDLTCSLITLVTIITHGSIGCIYYYGTMQLIYII